MYGIISQSDKKKKKNSFKNWWVCPNTRLKALFPLISRNAQISHLWLSPEYSVVTPLAHSIRATEQTQKLKLLWTSTVCLHLSNMFGLYVFPVWWRISCFRLTPSVCVCISATPWLLISRVWSYSYLYNWTHLSSIYDGRLFALLPSMPRTGINAFAFRCV